MQRYFGRKLGNNIILDNDDILHLTKVMRARRGEQIEVVADEKVYLCEIKEIKPLQIVSKKQLKENSICRRACGAGIHRHGAPHPDGNRTHQLR